MSKLAKKDFREAFDGMSPHAVVTRTELAALLSTSIGAVSQMAYRGELPVKAFPLKRRACWFAGDIRIWLENFLVKRNCVGGSHCLSPIIDKQSRRGRPRLSNNRVK